jgi:MEMO1 family protein
MIRNASFQGRFYPGTKSTIFQLIEEIEQRERYHIPSDLQGRGIGAVLPHAAHMYSGYQTVPFFKYLVHTGIVPETFVILNPNHSGNGPHVARDPNEIWRNAAGDVLQDTILSELLPYPENTDAQRNEHSAEVIVPFIQYYFRDQGVKILPLCIRDQTSSTARKLADDLYRAVSETKRNIIIIASSDFSHFLTPELGHKKDQLVLDRIYSKDIEGLEKTVKENHVSVCGYGPVMTLMAYAEMVAGDYRSVVLARGHSGDVFPSREVVDYISLLFYTGI